MMYIAVVVALIVIGLVGTAAIIALHDQFPEPDQKTEPELNQED